MEKRKETEPFTELEKSDLKGVASKLFSVPGHEDMVVRKSFVNVPLENAFEMTIHEKAEYLHNKAVEFKKIVDRLGIRMAKTDYVIGTDPAMNRPALFGVTERVDGENLHTMVHINAELADKVDELYVKILSGLFESYIKYDYSWYDSNNEQFVFGKAKGDKQPELYLVDVDPNIFTWGPEEMSQEERESNFWKRLEMILGEIEEIEGKVTEKGFKCSKSRQAIDKIIKEIPNFS
jgi:hypothetical protein